MEEISTIGIDLAKHVFPHISQMELFETTLNP